MKHNKILSLILALCLALVFLCSCADRLSSSNYHGGEVIDKEKLSSIAGSVTDEDNTVNRGEHDGVYYWIDKSSLYHMWRDCSKLDTTLEIYSGNITEAYLAGKATPCSECVK